MTYLDFCIIWQLNNLNLVNLYFTSIHNANWLFHSTFYQSGTSTFLANQMTAFH